MKIFETIKYTNFFQYIFIVILICGTIYHRTNKEYQVVKKNDIMYRKMYFHYKISKFVKKCIKICNINHYHILSKYEYKNNDNSIFEESEYIYFFRSRNLLVYFFKQKKETNHKVYFEGVDEISDLKYLSFPNKWFNEYTLQSIHKNLSEKGFLFKITQNEIKRIHNTQKSIFSIFSYMNHTIYIPSVIKNIEIEGYSLGGVLSQVFTYILISKKYVKKYNLLIHLYIIESWWGGNNEFYEYLSSYITIHNVMCMGSILYYYNIFFQNYFKVNKYIQFPLKKLFYKYIQLPFPFGFTEYFGDHHYISRFLRFY